MPAHNAEAYVASAIASVLRQSFSDFELIVVDDASTDSTAAIVGSFDDRRVHCSQMDRRTGPAGTRNRGLELARGRFVAFLDADDLAYRHRLAKQLDYMVTYPDIALLGAGYDVIDASGKVLATLTNPSGTGSVRLKMLFDNTIATSLAFARRDPLLESGGFNERLAVGEDHDMWARVASRYPIARLAEVLGAYREHPAGTYRSGIADVDDVRSRVVCRIVESVLGISIPLGTAMVLGDASSSSDHTLADCVVALALLELLPHSAPWQWADSPTERRASTRVWIDKLVVLACKEPRLKRDALRAAARVLLMGPARNVWDRATVRSVIRLVLAPGGRERLRRVSRIFAGDSG
jgi:glycosyltransferase involved in cell wall biosynthesis